MGSREQKPSSALESDTAPGSKRTPGDDPWQSICGAYVQPSSARPEEDRSEEDAAAQGGLEGALTQVIVHLQGQQVRSQMPTEP